MTDLGKNGDLTALVTLQHLGGTMARPHPLARTKRKGDGRDTQEKQDRRARPNPMTQ